MSTELWMVDPSHKNTVWAIIEKLSHCEAKLIGMDKIVDRPE
ncbi:hypothetical protein [Candidatus Endomicrobiellum trichonymphae]|nr:hypothetical protein [Candidatus Endomicrobium trichonymphae]